MFKKTIVIIAYAADFSGAKSILNQIINEAINELDQFNFVIFVSENMQIRVRKPNLEFVKLKRTKGFYRIILDQIGIKFILFKRNIRPQLVVSIQNTVPKLFSVKSLAYLNTSLPFCNLHFSILREPKLWFYRWIYIFFLRQSYSKSTSIIVQTEWMKNSVIKKGLSYQRIDVLKPSFMPSSKIDPIAPHLDFFYPATDLSYKNHQIIIDALVVLKQNHSEGIKNFKIGFTLDQSSSVFHKAKKQGVDKYIEFLGYLSHDKISSYYAKSKVLLFPSKTESFGLPLLEAQSFGLSIICSDLPYAKEVCNDYKNTWFVSPTNSYDWALTMLNNFQKTEAKPPTPIHGDWEEFRKLIEHLIENE